jgi:hypothetical protein
MDIELQRRTIDTLPYVAGDKKFIDLPKDEPLHSLLCRMTGRCTISGGTTSGTPWTENPMTLINKLRVYGTAKRIEKNVNGRRVLFSQGGNKEIHSIDASMLYTLNSLYKSKLSERAAISSGAAASYDFISTFEVPFNAIGMVQGSVLTSLLPAWWFSELRMEVEWKNGALTNGGGLISAGDRAIALTAYGSAAGSPQITTVAVQAMNIDHNSYLPALFRTYKKTLVTEVVEGARKEAMNKGPLYRAMLFRAFSDTAERATTDALVNHAKVNVGGNPREDWDWAHLRAENASFYGIDMPAGYAMIDPVRDGMPQQMIDTSDYSNEGTSFELELNLNGAANNRLDVVTLEMIHAGQW